MTPDPCPPAASRGSTQEQTACPEPNGNAEQKQETVSWLLDKKQKPFKESTSTKIEVMMLRIRGLSDFSKTGVNFGLNYPQTNHKTMSKQQLTQNKGNHSIKVSYLG